MLEIVYKLHKSLMIKSRFIIIIKAYLICDDYKTKFT